jgi:glutathione synthase/RimK-type ligase-like ATP-grasp enzyme
MRSHKESRLRKIAILRCEKLPSFITWEIPNLEELFQEDQLLIEGFQAQGLQASPVVWSDPGIDWDQFDLALIRSTWDYLDASERFLHVLANIEASSCRLFNPLSAVRWNMDKRYLLDLARQGVPVIPTFAMSDVEPGALRELFIEHRWHTVILKPTIGLAGSNTHRIPLDQLESTRTDLRASQPLSAFLIQPFVETILTEGEWSFVYFNRQLSHVLLKKPAPNDFRVQGIYGGTIQPAEPQPRDLLQAEAVLDKLPPDILYARLDFVRVEGQLAVMEVELIEPIFSFNLVPESVARLVQATKMKL